MLGFPNRMLYPDFKSRYAILGAKEIASSSDNKVFFRAGALAGLEEERDEIVLKLVRWMQGQCFGHMKRKVYGIKYDQRELMKVIQANFRKYQILRNWGWFIIIQKTRPIIGQVNIEEELRNLEEKANSAYGAYKEQLDTKARLLEENVAMEAEKKALLTQLESEQGNLSEYTERQAKASAMKADLEVQLADATETLGNMEALRQDKTAEKKELETDNVVIKKDIEDLELAIQKLEQEKTNRDHTIRTLSDEISNQDEVINKLNKEKKHLNENHSKAAEDLQVQEDKLDHLSNIKTKLEQTLDELHDSLEREKRGRTDVDK